MIKILLLIAVACLDNKNLSSAKKTDCGYKQCPQTREGALNVHLIPHAHMDAGWVKTYDQYYYGSKPSISTANVQLIYHSVLSELLHDKRRKFTFSEVSYFWRWWKEQRPATRSTFRGLVQDGRIEFAGGGWVQGDEATADYLMLLDHFTWGLRKLNDTLGPCGKPKAAWQIDTYGHTREQVSLLAQMGYDGLFIGRVNHKERESMLEEERMEFMWRGSDVLGKMSDIMTHTLYNLYNAPDGYCFDFLCNEEPIIDDPDSRVYNADKRVNDFISQIEHQAKYYEHDNIMVTMGGDFTYQSAANWFMNMDKLINHVNTHPANMSDINIFYSTPSCYLKALYLYGRRDKAIYTEKGDHLPYGSDANTYWTGFYTSRPSLKYFTRRANVFLQIVKQLTVIARMGDSYELHLLRHALGLMMHHDAITGTSQQHVANDFVKILTEAIDACAKKASTLLSYLTPTWGGSRRSKNNQQFSTCHQLNLSQCTFAESQESLLLVVYNPQSTKTYHYVRLPAIALHYVVRNAYDEEVEYQLVQLPPPVANLPGRTSTTNHELVFEAENVPPLGYVAFFVTAVKDPLEEIDYLKKKKLGPDLELISQISNEYLKVIVSRETGLLEAVQHVDGARIQLSQNFHYYSQTRGSLQSGAYSFRPDAERPAPVTDKVTYNTVRGPLVKEIHQRFNSWVHQTLRLYRGEEFLEMDWVIGPVPIGTDLGKEIVSIFSTNISNRGEFYTDSNARQMMKRSCWNESVGMCILTDRCQGGTSYRDGEVELMVHRRLLTDDGFGLDETLNEEELGSGLVVRGRHRLMLGNHKRDLDELTFSERMSHAAHRWQMEPWQFVAAGDKVNRRKWQSLRNKRFSALRVHGLPRHVRVLTLEPWKANSVLLRLENTLEKSDRAAQKLDIPEEGPVPSHITVELSKVFQHMHIKSVRETTLGANQWLEDARQMDWSTRYVYTGGDDGLLPEDMDYVEEDKFKQKESEHYTEDDSDYIIRRNERRQPMKQRRTVRYEDRRKRSVNISENFIDNIINFDSGDTRNTSISTTDHDELTTELNSDDIRNISTTEYDELTTDFISEDVRNIRNLSTTEHDELITQAANVSEHDFHVTGLTTVSSKLNDLSSKGREYFRASESLEEEESWRAMLSRRNGRKKLAGHFDLNVEESDDGVTKSIYDMYYRNRIVAMPIKKPLIRNFAAVMDPPKPAQNTSKEVKVKSKKITELKKKKKKQTMSKLMTFRTPTAKVYESGEERPSGGEEEDEELVLGRIRARRNERSENRRKRAAERVRMDAPAPGAEAEPEYVVTLRPTQIRTFVIRFDSSRQNYVL